MVINMCTNDRHSLWQDKAGGRSMSSWLCYQSENCYGRESLPTVPSSTVSLSSPYSVIHEFLIVQQLIAASCLHSCLQHIEENSLHISNILLHITSRWTSLKLLPKGSRKVKASQNVLSSPLFLFSPGNFSAFPLGDFSALFAFNPSPIKIKLHLRALCLSKARNLMASKAILALTLLLAYFRLFFDGGFSAFIMGILCMYMYMYICMYMYCTVCVSIYDSVYVNNFYALHKYACVFYDPPCPTVCDCLDSQINLFCVCVAGEGRGEKTVGEGRPFWKALLSNQIQKE